MMVFDWSGDGGRILSEIDQVLDVHRWRLFPCMMAIRAVERVSRCSRNGFCSDSCVRKVWNTLVVLILVVLVIPQAIGLSLHPLRTFRTDFPVGFPFGHGVRYEQRFRLHAAFLLQGFGFLRRGYGFSTPPLTFCGYPSPGTSPSLS